jgi:dihydropteroate synthase
MQSKVFSMNKTLNLGGRLMELSTPRVMGILNITPDSFYDGNKHSSLKAALKQAEKMISEGADLIDVGGYSSRPGATDIPEVEETSRVLPVIQQIVKEFPDAFISVDTFRSKVARQAIEAGAVMVNDISGGEADAGMVAEVARQKAGYIIMHMRGTPQTMASLTEYDNLVKEVIGFFHPKVNGLISAGITDLIVDPGFGFAKTPDQNFELLKHLELFQMLGKPILVGLSRKSMIWRKLKTTAEYALNGTTSLNTVALLKGASILRVHDVKEAVEVVKLVSFVK